MRLFAAAAAAPLDDEPHRKHWRGHAVIEDQDLPDVPDAAAPSANPSSTTADTDATTATTTTTTTTAESKVTPINPWIRGVNLGGWLMLERYITPYTFAVTDCHLRGDFCWYPGQINAPPSNGDDEDDDAELCDLFTCKPMMKENVFGKMDFPMDEYNLWQAFLDYQEDEEEEEADDNGTKKNQTKRIQISEEWLQHHLDNFMQEDDIRFLAESGVTHIRVPLPHWILQDQDEILARGQVWIVGARWQAFQRLVTWSRKYQIQVWPDIHTAPGSQNGFDNSGIQFMTITGTHWSSNRDHVQESLDVIQQVTARIVQDDMQDVVTGFGLLNEPFRDTDRRVYLRFIEDGLETVRNTMGQETYVYVSDLFSPQNFNTGRWWMDAKRHSRTFLDTHYYQVFAENTRAISPRQHIARTCQNEYHVHAKTYKEIDEGGIASCCWRDPVTKTKPSLTVSRMVGEWSAAVDVLPVERLFQVMLGIAANGTAPLLDRQLTQDRQDFLRNFVMAQMVTYEAADKGIASAWFYWTVKMEGGAFAEWDFMRGLREGWIPSPLPGPDMASVDVYGTCYDIIFRTNDSMSIIDEFPNPADIDDSNNWQGMVIDDDVVVSHGQSLIKQNGPNNDDDHQFLLPPVDQNKPSGGFGFHRWSSTNTLLTVLLLSLGLIVLVRWQRRLRRKRDHHQYEPIGGTSDVEEVAVTNK
jgi:glucan 1,3-beta-glucosidase